MSYMDTPGWLVATGRIFPRPYDTVSVHVASTFIGTAHLEPGYYGTLALMQKIQHGPTSIKEETVENRLRRYRAKKDTRPTQWVFLPESWINAPD